MACLPWRLRAGRYQSYLQVKRHPIYLPALAAVLEADREGAIDPEGLPILHRLTAAGADY